MTDNDRDMIAIDSFPDRIAEVDEFLEDFLRRRGISEDIIADLAIAVTELVNNAIKHGNRQAPGKKVVITVSLKKGEVEAAISDEGEGFDPDSLPDPLAEENLLKEIGRGIFIVKSLMDDFNYSFSRGRGATISITKRLAG